VIVHHGYEKVEVKSSNGASGTMSFILSVGSDLCRFWLTVFCPVKMLLLVAKISSLKSVSKTRYVSWL